MNLSRRDLDSNVVNIELTLASIIQGVALAVAVAAITLGQYGLSGVRLGGRFLGAITRRA